MLHRGKGKAVSAPACRTYLVPVVEARFTTPSAWVRVSEGTGRNSRSANRLLLGRVDGVAS